ncbi:pilus assembly protein TadG-related protein [Rhodoferax sp.]|jgi:hypothetical protein|uniref:pilus assembly protein TadG-related protein n=2 Tax=Rhodoferax sp. TaxID=50421 RepID=UPI00273267DD|nr:pilus assembly protein TadG-related protein [Rhodoferax sp.]MDP3192124.1 pilus assembly protein TadG-related protein [Rhodoferax sp.]MDP3865559.1 pilus assembly protein TadG-related protein [Rhodoferax sp.]
MKTVTSLKQRPCQRQHQRGAVAIMLGLSLLVLFGFMALVFDLGRTYVVRTELQNAADAAALAGAKDLNRKAAGISKAIATATAIGLQNKTTFSFKSDARINITPDMISVGSCPEDACMVPASGITLDAAAADKTFIKVDIPSGNLTTFFARVFGNQTTQTFGRAVAGFYLTDVTPIGICAIDTFRGGARTSAAGIELTEFGFRRGVSYNIMELGPLGGSGQPYLLNPVDTWGGPSCDPAHSSANYTAPFVCRGTTAAVGTVPGYVYGNTGISAGPMQVALNSRFNMNACAPQDANVKTYEFGNTNAGFPASWMNPDPSRQSIAVDKATNKPITNPSFADYGVLWSYSRAVSAVGTSPTATAGTAFTLNDWPDLYGGGAAENYQTDPAAPYSATGGDYFKAPQVPPGKRDRRVLNLAIINCPASTGTGCNSTIRVEAIGKFFMQVKADLPKSIDAEFAGLVEPLPTDIRLYK